jgi:chromosome segregation protein
MTPLYAAISKYFDSESSLKATKASFDEGLTRLGKTSSTASAKDIEKVLKSNVYKQLQVALPPASAKTTVQKILDELAKLEKQYGSEAPAPKDPLLDRQAEVLVTLEQGLKRFGLYFDWVEVSKYRSQINVIKEQQAASRTVPELVRDAQAQLGALERKLQDLMVRQAQEIAELQSGFEKVKSIGGVEIKRLEALITQITEAHATQTLATDEVERARKIVLEKRKLIESSVVQVPSPTAVKAPTIVPSSPEQIKLAPMGDDGVIDIEDDFHPPKPLPMDQSGEAVVEVEGLEEGINIEFDFPELSLEQSLNWQKNPEY